MKLYLPFSQKYLDYMLGIFFGVALISVIFSIKVRSLNVRPKAKTMVNEEIGGDSIRMRYIFQAAVLIEEKGQEFYRELAEKAANPEVKELCSKLAEGESGHKKKFEDFLLRWLPRPAKRETLDAIINDLRSKGLFVAPPPYDASVKKVLEYAIRQEELSVEFYSTFEQAFPDEWKQMEIDKLVKEEEKHKAELIAILNKI